MHKFCEIWVDFRRSRALASHRRTVFGGGESLSAADVSQVFRPGEVARVLGVSRRQLQYWAQTDLIRPSVRTRGGHRRYTFEDLVALRVAKRLLDAGISVQRIRKSLRSLARILPRTRQPLANLALVAGDGAVLVFERGAAFEAESGQGWVPEVARLLREVRSRPSRPLPSSRGSRPARPAAPAGTKELRK